MTGAGDASLAVLLDNARAAVFAGKEAGLDTSALFVSPEDYRVLAQTAILGHHREHPLRVLGVEVRSRADLAVGTVQLAADRELPSSAC